MHWIVTTPRDLKWTELHDLLDRTGTPYTVVSGGSQPGTITPDVSPEGPVLCLGSHGLVRVAAAKGWSPGAIDIGWLGYRECIGIWGSDMLNADAVFGPFDRLGDVAFAQGGGRVFLRPAYDSKAFDALVVEACDVAGWQRTLSPRPDGDTPSMVCHPKEVLAEWRTWIVSGRVATASLYRRGGRALFDGRDVPDEMLAFARQAASHMAERLGGRAPAAYVLDVALTPEGHRIVEINGIAGARLYDCDVGRLFGALQDMVAPDAAPRNGWGVG